MNPLIRSILCVFTLGLAGCFPVERFWWSPNGARAVVVVGDKPQPHVVRFEGELGTPLATVQINDDFPVGVSWLPDGTGFVLHRVHGLATWEEARVLLPAEMTEDVERRALAIPYLLQAAAAVAGEAEVVESLLEVVSVRDKQLMSAAFYCAREKQKGAVEAALLAGPKGAEILANLKEEATPFQVHEICLIKLKNDQQDGESQSIVRSIYPIVLPKVSPKLPVVAYWKAIDDEENLVLEISTLDGSSRIEAGRSSEPTFDWAADGRSVVFTTPVSEGGKLFLTIHRETVVLESGLLATENREANDLAVAIMPSPPRLCVLPDDRVLFASQPAKLPALSSAFDPAPRLYLISSDGKSMAEVPTAPGDLPTNLSFFVASPDGRRVAVVESDTVAVAVVELATGKTEIVSPAKPGWNCRTMPAWRSSNELTFAAFDGTAKIPKWMLWKQGEGVRSISEKWPDTVTKDWLTEKKDPITPAKEAQ